MKKTLFAFLAIVATLFVGLTFTSCNSSDDPTDKEVVYSITVTSDYDGIPNEGYMDEMNSVQKQYDEYFSANFEHKFSCLTSDIAAQNSKIATHATIVNTALQAQTWHYTFKVVITNVSTGETVYRATYKP